MIILLWCLHKLLHCLIEPRLLHYKKIKYTIQIYTAYVSNPTVPKYAFIKA